MSADDVLVGKVVEPATHILAAKESCGQSPVAVRGNPHREAAGSEALTFPPR